MPGPGWARVGGEKRQKAVSPNFLALQGWVYLGCVQEGRVGKVGAEQRVLVGLAPGVGPTQRTLFLSNKEFI